MNTLVLIKWVSNFDLRTLTHCDGSLETLARQYKIHEGQGLVCTSRGWHRLRILARVHGRAVVIIPNCHETPLVDLVSWAAKLRGGPEIQRAFTVALAKAA